MLFWMEWCASLHPGVNISSGKNTNYLHAVFNIMSIIAERPKHSLQIKARSLQEKLNHQNINGWAEKDEVKYIGNYLTWDCFLYEFYINMILLCTDWYMNIFFLNKFDLKEFCWPYVLGCWILCSFKGEIVEAVQCKPALKSLRKQSVKASKTFIF